jgi:uncharacterized repeat protein (TIGR04076 family)
MERRKFLKASSIGSTCALAGAFVAKNAVAYESGIEEKCKITVLKRTLNKDWNKKFKNMEGSKCEVFEEGQEFAVESPWEMPAGFCHWAWADIRTFIHLVNEGRYQTFVSCCTDGFRPVFFKIERNKG